MTRGFDLKLKDADVWYYPNFFSTKESEHYFKKLLSETKWQQDEIMVYGKTYRRNNRVFTKLFLVVCVPSVTILSITIKIE
jgi:menaquinone-dependent protoporphyrinogen IX oxidase